MLDQATNIALMRLAPSFEQYHAFCSEAEQSMRAVAPVTDDDEGSHAGSTKSSELFAGDDDSVSSQVEERRHPDSQTACFNRENGKGGSNDTRSRSKTSTFKQGCPRPSYWPGTTN